jgi:hypothetical protein
MSEPKEQITRIVDSQPIEITLTKGMKNNFGWTVSVKAATQRDALNLIGEINAELQRRYGFNPQEVRPKQPAAEVDDGVRSSV